MGTVQIGSATTVGTLRALLYPFRDDTTIFCDGAKPVAVSMEWDEDSEQTWIGLSGLKDDSSDISEKTDDTGIPF